MLGKAAQSARLVFLGLLTMLVGATSPEARIPYPAQAIVLIVPAPRGGGTDIFARHLAELVEEELGQRVIIDNQPRKGGVAGIEQMVAADPDGYRLAFVWNSPLTVAPLSTAVGYRPDDYRAVMSIGFSSYVLCVRPEFPADDGQAFLDHLRASPGVYSYGNDGAAGTMRLAADRIFRSAGAEVRGIAFAGANETARNLLAGNVDIYGGSLPPILPHVASGAVKCPLLTSADRNAVLPGASGLEELGLAGEETVLWWGLIAPAAVPDAVIERLERAFLAAASSPAFEAGMRERGAVPRARGAHATREMIEAEVTAFGAILGTSAQPTH